MNEKHKGIVIAVVLLAVITGLAVAAGKAEAATPPRGQAYNQGLGTGQTLTGGRGAGQGQGQGFGRVAGSGTGGAGNFSAGGDQALTYRSTEIAALAAMPIGTLQTDEITKLLYIWEEEKLARDVYTKLGDLYGMPLFSNIARSEQTHMDQMAVLLERYKLDLPETDSPGVFRDAGLAQLYEDLVARGSKDLSQAIAVGIAIEELDIQDLEEAIQLSGNKDVQYILNQLLMGSRNHLAAFQRQAQR
jgi:hypothetical protein